MMLTMVEKKNDVKNFPETTQIHGKFVSIN